MLDTTYAVAPECEAQEQNAGVHVMVDRRPACATATRAAGATPLCGSCFVRHVCSASNPDQDTSLASIGGNWRVVRQGQALYRSADDFKSIYVLRSGSFKTVVAHQSGQEYVSAFFLPGEVLGLDGIPTEHHACDAIALEDSAVCIVPFHLLETLCREVKSMQQSLHRTMAAEIVRETGHMMLMSRMNAEQRVAAFLLDISARLRRRGYSATEFTLRMTREEIGSYLGLTLETVSRTLSGLQREGWILVQGKRITLLDTDALDAR